MDRRIRCLTRGSLGAMHRFGAVIALRSHVLRCAVGLALLAILGSDGLGAGAAASVPPACPECQWHLPKGWKFDGDLLRGPDAAFEVSLVGEAPEAPAPALEVEPEVARLVSELGERGLVAKEPVGRFVTTALGEPTILIEYALAPKAGEVLPAPRGARLVRRCGTTATFDLFADPAEPQKLSKAASAISWARADCARFNRTAYVGNVDPPAPVDLATVVIPPPPPPAGPEGEGVPWTLLGGFAGLTLLLVGATLAYNRFTYRRLPPIRITPVAEPVAGARAPERARATERPPTSDDVAEAAREVYEQPTASASTSAEIQGAMAELARAVPLTRNGVPFAGASGVPDRYLEVLQIADGSAWGEGWFRLLGARPGAVPDVKDLNRRLSRVLGGRFAIGYGGFGIVVALESKGTVVACEPYFGSLVRVADGLPEMFSTLAKESGVRAQVCDPERLRSALAACGPLADGEVFDPGAGEPPQKVSLLTLWSNASPLPKG